MSAKHRFIVLGTGATFTCKVIQTLTRQGYPPVAYLQYPDQRQQKQKLAGVDIEICPAKELTTLLEKSSIPLYRPQQNEMASFIQQLHADFLLVACWPELLPASVLDSVSASALNLHPSLLPAFRGPDPVRAQLDAGDTNFGITLHIMNEQYDAGDIVLQDKLSAPVEPHREMIESAAAELGAHLFIRALDTFHDPGWTLTKQER